MTKADAESWMNPSAASHLSHGLMPVSGLIQAIEYRFVNQTLPFVADGN
jgi:hypothetical protein